MVITEPLTFVTVPKKIFPETRGCPTLTSSSESVDETVLFPMAPETLTGSIDLKSDLGKRVFLSARDCFRSSFSDSI